MEYVVLQMIDLNLTFIIEDNLSHSVNSILTMLCLNIWLTHGSDMNWNGAFDLAKDKNFWKTSIKDYPM